ncbi:MAG: hypothetical protein ACD_49C00066G0013 [uncultured bacterium (gcode 4)]|uniref:Uncharacterized protein n=1 Tax=uncultured bacterium (gcode 4) TaxID=1234023 RepID=K2BV29_9BACT|nr:MAG: hypothetical protein ACD_49C00066G0013 [uncultured bacterium (gcode 4)]
MNIIKTKYFLKQLENVTSADIIKAKEEVLKELEK